MRTRHLSKSWAMAPNRVTCVLIGARLWFVPHLPAPPRPPAPGPSYQD